MVFIFAVVAVSGVQLQFQHVNDGLVALYDCLHVAYLLLIFLRDLVFPAFLRLESFAEVFLQN